jgi:hypothetical protein
MTLTSFPRLGVPGRFTVPYFDPAEAVSSHSLFLPEQITNPHARFPCVPACGFLCASNTNKYDYQRSARPGLRHWHAVLGL